MPKKRERITEHLDSGPRNTELDKLLDKLNQPVQQQSSGVSNGKEIVNEHKRQQALKDLRERSENPVVKTSSKFITAPAENDSCVTKVVRKNIG